MSEKVLRKANGMPYEVVGEQIVIYPADQEPITVEMELGKSVYSTVQKVTKKLLGKSKSRNTAGNFTYVVEEGVLSIFRKNGELLVSKELSEKEMKQVRTAVLKTISEVLE